jgi:thiamine kinase-like enzyme
VEAHWTDVAAGAALIHADLRPDNLILRDDGEAFVVDWAGHASEHHGSSA